MHWFYGERLKYFVGAVTLAVVTLAAGCRTVPQSLFTVSGEGWQVREGQAVWRPRQGLPELAGDVVLVQHPDGRCLIEFSKTPLVMLSAQVTATNWLIRFPGYGRAYTGRGKPTKHFAWLHLPEALRGETPPKEFQFQLKPGGNWKVENPRSGESLEGYLAP